MESGGAIDHEGQRIAWRRHEGAGPTVVWFGGFRSDMSGTKAEAVALWAQLAGRSYLRFDYMGHGFSSGAFKDGNISRWRSDALAVVDRLSEGPLVLVGSSMGAWIALLVAQARPERVKSMVLLAPAPDFTDKLIEPGLSEEAKAALARDGVWVQRSEYDPTGYLLTQQLLDDGRKWSVLPGPIEVKFPVHILQGSEDREVPPEHALTLGHAIRGPSTNIDLLQGGDHRLSRPPEIEVILAAVNAA